MSCKVKLVSQSEIGTHEWLEWDPGWIGSKNQCSRMSTRMMNQQKILSWDRSVPGICRTRRGGIRLRLTETWISGAQIHFSFRDHMISSISESSWEWETTLSKRMFARFQKRMKAFNAFRFARFQLWSLWLASLTYGKKEENRRREAMLYIFSI